jgi:hypothetical protein
MLGAQWVVVTAGRRERRAGALADGMEMDTVPAGRQPGDLDVEVELAIGVLGEASPADGLPGRVDQAGTGMVRAPGGGHARGHAGGQCQQGQAGERADEAMAGSW